MAGVMAPLLGDPNADHEPLLAESLHDLGYDRNTQTTPDKAEERDCRLQPTCDDF